MSDIYQSATTGRSTPIDTATILQDHPDGVFRSRDNQDAPIEDLDDLNLYDEYGFEIKIFDINRRAIRRRTFVADEPQNPPRPAGILVNLDTVDEFFRSGNAYEDARDVIVADAINRYPYALIRNSGSVQTRRPLPLFQPLLEDINRDIEKPDLTRRALYSSSVQLYNLSIHWISPRANEHPSPHGLITASFLGRFARTEPEKKAAEKAARKLGNVLPYQNYNQKMLSRHNKPDLRIEQVFVIRANRLNNDRITPKYV